MSEKILLLVEEHVARKTNAETRFSFYPAPLSEPMFVGGGTHKKYLLIVKKGTTVRVIRTSNRGNVNMKEYIVNEPMYVDYLGAVFPMPSKYFALAKERGLL
ncbi:MAG: hypothetical protein QXP83_07860 [Candidatus Nezhaarchaeales archaeon]